MSRLEQIEKTISELSDDDFRALTTWFDEVRWERWDRQFEDDVKAGRLDELAEEALNDLRAGRTRAL